MKWSLSCCFSSSWHVDVISISIYTELLSASRLVDEMAGRNVKMVSKLPLKARQLKQRCLQRELMEFCLQIDLSKSKPHQTARAKTNKISDKRAFDGVSKCFLLFFIEHWLNWQSHFFAAKIFYLRCNSCFKFYLKKRCLLLWSASNCVTIQKP